MAERAKANARWLSEPEQTAWRAYIRMQAELEAQLNRRLHERFGLSMADYEVLVHLSEAPDGVLRLFELGRIVDWEKSRLSHHLTRMAKRGLVERRECPSDGRGAFVALTPVGRAAIERAAPGHVEDVRDLVVDVLGPDRLAALGDIANSVLAALADADEPDLTASKNP